MYPHIHIMPQKPVILEKAVIPLRKDAPAGKYLKLLKINLSVQFN